MTQEQDLVTETALVPIRPTVARPALLPTSDEMRVMATLASTLTKTAGSALPAHLDTPEKVFAVVESGRELGVAPMVATRHIFLVNGRTEPDSQLMMGIVLANDPTARFDWNEDGSDGNAAEVVLARTVRDTGGQGVVERTFRARYTIDMAYQSGQATREEEVEELRKKAEGSREDKRAWGRYYGAAKSPWRVYRPDMLRWAAVKRACRMGAPDLINVVEAVSSGAAAVEIPADYRVVVEEPAEDGSLRRRLIAGTEEEVAVDSMDTEESPEGEWQEEPEIPYDADEDLPDLPDDPGGVHAAPIAGDVIDQRVALEALTVTMADKAINPADIARVVGSRKGADIVAWLQTHMAEADTGLNGAIDALVAAAVPPVEEEKGE